MSVFAYNTAQTLHTCRAAGVATAVFYLYQLTLLGDINRLTLYQLSH